MTRSPTPILIVDANIVLSAVLGYRTRRTIAEVGTRRQLFMSARAEHEVLLVARNAARRQQGGEEALRELMATIEVAPAERYHGKVAPAELALREAVASRNGSERDAHILALAWTLEADIWSHDCDFAGTGWPSWSSSNLLAHLRAVEGSA